MPTVCTLGGFELPADAPIPWANVAGTKPAEHEIEVFPEDVKRILALRGPIELKCGKATWTNLWAIRESTGSDPYRASILVADRRWFWQRAHIVRRFNMRRRTGVFRIDANGSPELSRLEDNIAFARYSVTPSGEPWNTVSILRLVISDLAAFEAREASTRPEIRFEGEPQGVSPLNDVEVDAAGDAALAQVLGMIAGYSVRIDPDGAVVFFSTVSPDAGDAELEVLGEQFEGAGNARVVSHFNECPWRIRVLFTPDVELRFDYKDVQPNETAEADPNESLRRLKNVIPNPDYTLTIDGVAVPQETYVEADKLLAALPRIPGGARLTDLMLRKAMIPYCDIYQAICDLADFDITGNWRTRINVLMANFLQTFRIPRDWHDRALTWKAARLATVNQATGARAPAMAYGDYSLLTAMKRQLRQYLGAPNGSIEFARNFDGWAEEFSETSKPSPAKIDLDADIGVLRLGYQADPWKNFEMAFPAQLDNGTRIGVTRQSTALDGDIEYSLTFDSVLSANAFPPRLTSNHRVAVILTGTPAAPNDSRQLFAVDVIPDRDGVIYDTARSAKGPTMEVRVQPAYEVARLRWRDDRADDFGKLWGVIDGTPNLDGLCINKEPGSQDGVRGEGGRTVGASLDEIARSIAERIWASFVPHVQGSAEGDMNLDLVPRGWLDSVQHVVAPDGTMSSRATWPKRVQPLDWLNFISPSARAVILRQVYRGG